MLASDQFDAVFCCGPFYHLVSEQDRLAAGREIMRVCKRNGVILIGIIPRFSGLSGIIYKAAVKTRASKCGQF